MEASNLIEVMKITTMLMALAINNFGDSNFQETGYVLQSQECVQNF